jgi:hypothetical protein
MALALANSHYPIGRYTVSWDGKGRIGFPLSRVVLRDVEAQRMVVDVSDNRGPLNVAIDETQRPTRFATFVSCGRTRRPTARRSPSTRPSWKRSPRSRCCASWTGRNERIAAGRVGGPPRTGDLGYATAKGVPVERMVELANTLGADPWFCVPHQASDDYVRQFASLLHARLDPGLRPHIEYSNEVWNRGFAQSQWRWRRRSGWACRGRWGCLRSSTPVARSRSSSSSPRSTAPIAAAVIRVIAGHAAWTPFQESALAGRTRQPTPMSSPSRPTSSRAAGDPKNVEATRAMAPERLLDQMLADIRGPVAAAIRANAALARKHGLRLLATREARTTRPRSSRRLIRRR